jgi:Uma2 family endonuclease
VAPGSAAATFTPVATEAASKTLVTDEELALLPGDARRELIEGELRVMTPAGGDHGRIAARVLRFIDVYADEQGGSAFAAETGFKLASNPDTVRAPDAAYVSEDRARQVGASPGYWPGAPDLAVEVVSPNDTFSETHEKALMWLAAGARVVLVADPASAHVTRYRAPDDIIVFAGGQPVDCAPAMPGFAPPVAQLLGLR